MDTLNRLVGRAFFAVAILAEAAYASSACPAPPFRTGKVLEDTPSGISLHISIGLQDFAPSRLICLATVLKQRYGGRNVSAAIFSSYKAAVAYAPVTVEENPIFRAAQAKLHAFYTYDKPAEKDQLLILPDGLNHKAGSPFTTRIDLPVSGPVVCSLELSQRCLLEIEHIEYPLAGDRAAVSGVVTLSGNIAQNGVMSDVAVVEAKVSPIGHRSLIVNWAVHNLRTWRFEVGNHKDPVRITYRIEVSDFSPTWHEAHVEFRLPSEVIVQFGPKKEAVPQ
jgi:hypothetical protein